MMKSEKQKLRAPKVSLEKWSSLYEAFAKFVQKEPWKILSDDILFTINDPRTNETGYGCVLGELGEVMALCVYRGQRGLSAYKAMLDGTIDQDDMMGTQDCLMAEVSETGMLEKEDWQLVKKLGIEKNPEGRHPVFRSYLPGYAPWFLDEKEVAFLTISLLAASDFVDQFVQDRSVILRQLEKGAYLTYTPKDVHQKQIHWDKTWEKPKLKSVPVTKVQVNINTINAIQQKCLMKETVWEVDYFISEIGQICDRERPYFGTMIMIADATSQQILYGNIVSPEANFDTEVAQALCATMKKHQICPEAIAFRRASLLKALEPLTIPLDIISRFAKQLPMVSDIRYEMKQYYREESSLAVH